MEQEIRFCELDGRRIAYATIGEGPVLLFGGRWVSHLEEEWDETPLAGLNLRLREEIVAFGSMESNSGIRITLGVTNLASSPYYGRLAVCRIERGGIHAGQALAWCRRVQRWHFTLWKRNGQAVRERA